MAQVAQAYFHLQTDLSAPQLQRFGKKIDRAARAAAHRNFETEVRIFVEIEDGSLIGRITAFTVILSAYTGVISNYKGVKDSVKDMCEDARSFGADVCGKAIEFTGVSEKQVYRVERRTKTVGKLSRLLSDIERLEKSVNELSPTQIKSELGRLNRQLGAITKDLEPAETAKLERVLERTKLPSPKQWPVSEVEPLKVAKKEEQFTLTYETLAIEDANKQRREPLHYRNAFRVKPRKRVRARREVVPLLPNESHSQALEGK